jgi:hypothetical protein
MIFYLTSAGLDILGVALALWLMMLLMLSVARG